MSRERRNGRGVARARPNPSLRPPSPLEDRPHLAHDRGVDAREAFEVDLRSSVHNDAEYDA